MPTVAITVDCEAANTGKCYTKEIVRAAEEFTIPLTWLLFVSEKDPMSNVDLYHSEYYHRIPAWHEFGLLLSFENSDGYVADTKERGDAIRIGKDMLKSRHIKPTSFRAYRFDILPSDLHSLEDIGILVDASACPGGQDKHGVTRPEGPGQPYHPSYEDVSKAGDAKILLAPLASHKGVCGCLDAGWDVVRPVVEQSLAENDVTVLCLSDNVNAVTALKHTLALCKERQAQFVTLTQLTSLLDGR